MKNQKKQISLSLIVLFIAMMASCGGSSNSEKVEESTAESENGVVAEDGKTNNPSYDPNRGEGKFTKIDIGASLDTEKANLGQAVYDVKCGSCHKLTDEKLVGPGWAGVSTRNTPVWIMNFITNTDAMIDKDPKVQAQLELCLVRMPNQNLSDDDARNLLEFMRKNDGVK
jgi:hypothetical protein